MLHTVSPAPDRESALQRAFGVGRISAKKRGSGAVLDTLYQHGCAKIRVPKSHGPWLDAVLINSSGGLTGGDEINWSASAGKNTHLVVTSQACERIYRSISGPAQVATRLDVGPGARLDWLPQETILFDDAALSRTLEVDLAPDARFLGLEAVILGRRARGEKARGASLAENWRIRRGGVLVHAEASALPKDSDTARSNIALLDGAGAYATLCYVGGDADRCIDEVKALIAPFETAGASRIGDKIIVRALAPSGYALRKIVMPLISALSGQGAVPRLWSL